MLPPLQATPRATSAPHSARADLSWSSQHDRVGSAPVGASQSLHSARVDLAGGGLGACCPEKSRPVTSHGKIFKSWRIESDSRAANLVRTWWGPVEESVKAKKPQHLEKALKIAHGAQYLRTVRAVRRSSSLKAAERHALEMEMAARLVSARALHGKWQAGLQEVRAARAARDAEALGAALQRLDCAADDDDDEIAGTWVDLKRWRALAASLPALLKEGLQTRDVGQLREALEELTTNGPSAVECSDTAKRFVDRYALQTRALDSAVRAGSSRAIQIALTCWEFEGANQHVLRARQALDTRETQKRCLRSAIASKDMPQLHAAISSWDFEPGDEDLHMARTTFERYTIASAELDRLFQTPPDFVALARASSAWEFSQADPKFLRARGFVDSYKSSLRDALSQQDGWELQRIWLLGASGSALSSDSSFRKEVFVLLQDYGVACADLRRSMVAATSSTGGTTLEARSALSKDVAKWRFAHGDPLVVASAAFVQLQEGMDARRVSSLRAALDSRDIVLVRSGMRRLWSAPEDCSAVGAAREACELFEGSLEAVGSVALGLQLGHMRSAAERHRAQDTAARHIRRLASGVDATLLAEFKALAKPPRVVHAVLEMLMHVLSGIDPNIRDPPGDTDWRSCQRMVGGPAALLAGMDSVPDWVAAGHKDGVIRARKTLTALELDLGAEWAEELLSKSRSAAHIFAYLEAVLAYAHSAQAAATHSPVEPKTARSATGYKRPPLVPTFVVAANTNKEATADTEEERVVPSWEAELDALARAKDYLCSNATAAASWVVLGGDPGQLSSRIPAMRAHATSTRAIAVVAQQVLGALAEPPTPATTLLSRLPGGPVGAQPFADEALAPDGLALTVKLISGDVVAQLRFPPAATPSDVKSVLEASEGTPARLQRLALGATSLADDKGLKEQNVTDGSLLTLIRASASLSERLGLALSAVAPALREAEGPHRKSALEPARDLVFGPSGEGGSVPARRVNLEQALQEVIRSCMEVIEGHSSNPGDVPLAIRQCAAGGQLPALLEAATLNERLVRSLRLPFVNIAFARRTLASAEHCPASLVEVLETVIAFFEEYLPQRAVAAAAIAAAEEAELAYTVTGRIVHFASLLSPMLDPPRCSDAEAVAQLARSAAEQIQTLASQCVVLPTVHVEYVQKAIDSSGLAYLENPPAADPGDRIRWAEEVVALQLAGVPHFQIALTGIVGAVAVDGLSELMGPLNAPSSQALRLISAVIWIIKSDCRCDMNWANAREFILADPSAFAQVLVDWELIRDAAPKRLARALSLLQEIWGWVLLGCGGSAVLSTLCAWASLVVSLLPMVELSQRLLPVHRELMKGLARIKKAAPKQAQVTTAKAWTSALFLLDASGRPWWWLGLIRPAASKEPPWTDNEDGGVAASTNFSVKQVKEAPPSLSDLSSNGALSSTSVGLGQPADGAQATPSSSAGDRPAAAVVDGQPASSESVLEQHPPKSSDGCDTEPAVAASTESTSVLAAGSAENQGGVDAEASNKVAAAP